MELNLTTATGKASKKTVEVSDANFGREFNESLVHQSVTAYLAGARQGSVAQKNRAAVSGGGKKPFKQKGTGRARAGTTRGPIWRSGGVTFAAQPRDYSQKLNKKMYAASIRSILSELVRLERLIVVDDVKMDAPKTKELVAKLTALGVIDSVLIVMDDLTEEVVLASRNIPHVDVCQSAEINPLNLVGYDKVLMTASAVLKIEETLS